MTPAEERELRALRERDAALARVAELENSIWTMGERYAAKQARITALEEALRDISNYRGNASPTPFWREIMRIVDTALAAAEKGK